jgi:TonB family protein
MKMTWPRMNTDGHRRFRGSVFILTAAVAICTAQEGPFRAGNGVSTPTVLQKTEPSYSEEARVAAVDGNVRISLVVDSQGNPSDLKVTRPIGFGLDEAALRSIASWKFKPGMKDGLAVPVQTSIEVNFRLLDKGDTLHMERFVCKLPEGASRPKVLKSEHPPSPGPDETVSVTISMDVNERGVPENLHLVKLTEAKWENDVIAAMREWRFQPSVAGGDGKPVVAPCTLSFAVGKMPVSASAYQIGGGISPPNVITKVQPEFSMEASRARLEGKVVLMVVVDESGKAREMKVIRPLGLGLDEKAIEAVGEWVFHPGSKDGQAVAVQATIEVNFRILDKRDKAAWHTENVAFRLPKGGVRPHLVSTKFPAASDAADSVTVSFEVDESGKPVNLHADKSSDEKWERKMLAAVKDWRFEPGLKDGKAIAVPCTVSVAMGR